MREFLARRRQLLTFLAGGGTSALIDVGLMQLLILNGVNYVIATSAGFLAGLAFNYIFHTTLTFQHAPTRYTFVRYLCVVGLNYLLTLAFVSAAVALLGNPLAGKIIALCIVPVASYLLGKHWIFK